MSDFKKLLYADELAEALRRSRGYICAMKSAGFLMPGGTASVEEARAWLREHPNFSTTAYYAKSKRPACPVKELEVSFSG